MRKFLIIFAVIILGLGLYGAYWYFTQPRISVESVNGDSITFNYANLPPGSYAAAPDGTRVGLVNAAGSLQGYVQWTPPTQSGSATVTAPRGTAPGTYLLRAHDADADKPLAESGTFELGAAGSPMASIDQQ